METPPVERNGNTSGRTASSGGGDRPESDAGLPAAPGGLPTVAEVTTTAATSAVADRQLQEQPVESSVSAAVQVRINIEYS